MTVRLKKFTDYQNFVTTSCGLFQDFFEFSQASPRLMLLSGGSTPYPIYQAAMEHLPQPDRACCFGLSDERVVPYQSTESNYGRLQQLVSGWELLDQQFLKVDTTLPTDSAAMNYHRSLAGFLDSGGICHTALLGLGSDGHTASLFSPNDFPSRSDLWAVPILRPQPPDRVSVTPALLQRFVRVVFLVAGAEKSAVVEQLLQDPLSLTAGLATQGCPSVELWWSVWSGGVKRQIGFSTRTSRLDN